MAWFAIFLEGWRSISKPVKLHELVHAYNWPAGHYLELADMGDMDAAFSPHGLPGNLQLTLVSAPFRPRWSKEVSRLARWLDEQSGDVVSLAATSHLRLGIVVNVWSSAGQPLAKLGAPVLTAAARLKLPIRIVTHIGERPEPGPSR